MRRVRPRATPLPDVGDAPPRRVKAVSQEAPSTGDAHEPPVRKSDG